MDAPFSTFVEAKLFRYFLTFLNGENFRGPPARPIHRIGSSQQPMNNRPISKRIIAISATRAALE